jgi:hypothetical protein
MMQAPASVATDVITRDFFTEVSLSFFAKDRSELMSITRKSGTVVVRYPTG